MIISKRFNILWILLLLFSIKLTGNSTTKKIHLTLIFDSMFNSSVYRKPLLAHYGRMINIYRSFDTFYKKTIHQYYNLKQGQYVLIIPTLFFKNQEMIINLDKDSVIILRNNLQILDSIPRRSFSSDTFELVFKNEWCRDSFERRILVVKVDTVWKLINLNNNSPPDFNRVDDFINTIYKSDEKRYLPESLNEKIVSVIILEDLYRMQCEQIDKLFEAEKKQIKSSGGKGSLYLKVGNGILVLESQYAVDWKPYYNFEKKYFNLSKTE